MKDRKEYWRTYQQNRYRTLKERKQAAPELTKQFKVRFKEECLLQGITREHKFWRTRQKIKLKIYQELGTTAEEVSVVELRYFFWRRSRSRARTAKLEFTITPTDIKLPDVCVILRTPLDYSQLGTANSPNAPSADRIDNSLGYIPGNVQVISHRANKLKNDANLEELVLLGAWAKRKLSRISDT